MYSNHQILILGYIWDIYGGISQNPKNAHVGAKINQCSGINFIKICDAWYLKMTPILHFSNNILVQFINKVVRRSYRSVKFFSEFLLNYWSVRPLYDFIYELNQNIIWKMQNWGHFKITCIPYFNKISPGTLIFLGLKMLENFFWDIPP